MVCHVTFNIETVYRQMPWAGDIVKTITSNKKQFTATHEMLTAVARDQSMQLKVAWFAFVLFWSITNHLMTGPLGNNENIEILGKQNSLYPLRPALVVEFENQCLSA